MATVTAQDIQKIYLAYFGRPADPGGLAYWLQKVNESGGDLSIMAAGFSSSEESKALYAMLRSPVRPTASTSSWCSATDPIAGCISGMTGRVMLIRGSRTLN